MRRAIHAILTSTRATQLLKQLGVVVRIDLEDPHRQFWLTSFGEPPGSQEPEYVGLLSRPRMRPTIQDPRQRRHRFHPGTGAEADQDR